MSDIQSRTKINYYDNIRGSIYEVKILINKAIGIVVNNPIRKILPYIYYKFYNNGEKYSQISSGIDPIFEDVGSFKVSYNKDFINYIEKENLNVYIFDGMNPIEIDIKLKLTVAIFSFVLTSYFFINIVSMIIKIFSFKNKNVVFFLYG